MKATIVLIVIVALAVTVLAAQPAEPGVRLTQAVANHGNEPIWMVLSGAALLSLASALRRYMP
jgi:hypothetical protein